MMKMSKRILAVLLALLLPLLLAVPALALDSYELFARWEQVRAFTRPKTAARRSAQKPETTWVRHQVPAATAPSESSVTSSILPQQRRI